MSIGAITVRPQTISIADARGTFGKARVTSECSGNERAISGGTHWSDDNATYELVTSELQPYRTHRTR